jgi:cyclin-dependent kinase-like
MEAYELLGTIGEGTYGVVLKARDRDTKRIVAIKKFKESDEDERVRKTALREVRILKQLRHENVVALLGLFRRNGKLYLVFEYVDRTLLEELERSPDGMDPGDVKRVMWQLARSVDYLHSHQVIHRGKFCLGLCSYQPFSVQVPFISLHNADRHQARKLIALTTRSVKAV